MPEDIKLPLASPDPSGDLLAQLRAAAPLVFSEGKVDFDRLKAVLGEQIESNPERYGLTWAGKSDAFRNVQAPSVGTLLPMPEDSVNWDSTENLIIEGDNLEVLKLLQKPYHGKVKMIYIDPPYNTGNEFIYPDNFREGLDDYLRYSGQVSEEGIKQSTNTETSGRFHSKWLSMMYPRLFLARSLLRDDGVIFVSIDDNEVHNLRMLMNEVFGEENFLANIVWQKKYSPQNDEKYFSESHEHLLTYTRNLDCFSIGLLPRTDKADSRYKNPDSDPRGPWKSSDLTRQEYRPRDDYEIVSPRTSKSFRPPKGNSWGRPKEVIEALIKDNRIWFGPDGNGVPSLKRFLSDVKQGITPQTLWLRTEAGDTQEGKKVIKEIFGDVSVFDTPKPYRLIQMAMLTAGCSQVEAPIILDFFSGSGTTAHAALDANQKDGGNRKFILVQLPEKIDNPTYPTIAHITRDRVRKVLSKLERKDKSDHGFRAFRLSSSNFKIWNAEKTSDDPEKLAEQLKLYANNVERARSEQDILYELILKSGLPLSSKVEQISIEGEFIWSVNENKLLIYLNKLVTRALLHEMLLRKPEQLLCLDAAFGGDDALKTNVVLEAKSHGVAFHTI